MSRVRIVAESCLPEYRQPVASLARLWHRWAIKGGTLLLARAARLYLRKQNRLAFFAATEAFLSAHLGAVSFRAWLRPQGHYGL